MLNVCLLSTLVATPANNGKYARGLLRPFLKSEIYAGLK